MNIIRMITKLFWLIFSSLFGIAGILAFNQGRGFDEKTFWLVGAIGFSILAKLEDR